MVILIAKVNHFLMGDIWMYGWMSRKWLKLDQWFDISELDDNSYVLTLYVGYIRIDGLSDHASCFKTTHWYK